MPLWAFFKMGDYNIRNNLSGNYILMNDIDLSSWGNWEPIGSNENAFTGIFDGNGFVIKNMTITGGNFYREPLYEVAYGGLFYCAFNAEIRNVGMINNQQNIQNSGSAFNGLVYTGGIVSNCKSSIIDNCYNTGKIIARYIFNTIKSNS